MDWLEHLGIGDFAKRNVEKLSGGQRQRVALARALVTEPQVLLLDEPLSALDAHLVIRMQGVLTRLQRELGITFVYVTHSQSEAFAMADRVVIMNDGEISQIGGPRDIYRAPANRFIAEFVGRNNILSGKVERLEAGEAVVATPAGTLTVVTGESSAVRTGEQISFAIAADLVQLSEKPPSEGNCVPVSLISEEFIGSVVTLFLESADGTEFKAQLQERELANIDLKSANELYLSWPAANGHILGEHGSAPSNEENSAP